MSIPSIQLRLEALRKTKSLLIECQENIPTGLLELIDRLIELTIEQLNEADRYRPNNITCSTSR